MLDLIKNIIGVNEQEEDINSNSPRHLKLGLIVGHTMLEPGARLVNSLMHEYDYNKLLAWHITNSALSAPGFSPPITQFRDGIGILGAYRELIKQKPDCIIELHFNAFDTKSTGTTTLCTSDANDLKLSILIHTKICRVFSRLGDSRGVQAIPRNSRGGVNLYAAGSIPNCLIEPFFGDNPIEAKEAVLKQKELADAIIGGVRNWALISNMLIAETASNS